ILQRYATRPLGLGKRLDHVATLGKHDEIGIVSPGVWIAILAVVKLGGTGSGKLEIGLRERSHRASKDGFAAFFESEILLLRWVACPLSQQARPGRVRCPERHLHRTVTLGPIQDYLGPNHTN